MVCLCFLLCLAISLTPASAKECKSAHQCSRGTMLPAWKPIVPRNDGEKAGRAIVYLIALLYMFLGVSIIADKFMAAIEVITSKEREVRVQSIGGSMHTLRVRVWNDTVANLTLMALGSSAPEIMLSVIEIIGKGFEAGDLGPGTMVGSAAFNLFLIVGFCVSVIPTTDTRRINNIAVFWVVAGWSLFAYLWLFLIIACILPREVEVWEGTLTLLFFPLTVLSAYAVDVSLPRRLVIKLLARRGKTSTVFPVDAGDGLEDMVEDAAMKDFEKNRSQYLAIFKKVRRENPDMDIQTCMQVAEKELIRKGPKTRAFYRVQVTRQLIGAGDVISKYNNDTKLENMTKEDTKSKKGKQNYIEMFFDPGHYTCIENVGTMYLTVRCKRGDVHTPCDVYVDYATADGTAKKDSDYIETTGTIIFKNGPNENAINVVSVPIVDNELFEDDEHFYVILSNPR